VVARHLSGHSESGRSSLSVAHRKYAALLKFYDKNYPRRAIFWLLARDLLRFTFRWVVHSLSPRRTSFEKASEYRGRIQALWDMWVRESVPTSTGWQVLPVARRPGQVNRWVESRRPFLREPWRALGRRRNWIRAN